jgi:hypothetical protein
MSNQPEKRGCRECEELNYHAGYCKFDRSGVTDNIGSPVLDSERAAPSEAVTPHCPECKHPRSSFNSKIGACEEAMLVDDGDVQPCFHRCEIPTPATEAAAPQPPTKPTESDLNALMKHNNAIYKSDIDKFWAMLDRCFEMEPREYFEKEARLNGFDSPLAMACFFMWKREAKVDASRTANAPQPAAAVESDHLPGRVCPECHHNGRQVDRNGHCRVVVDIADHGDDEIPVYCNHKCFPGEQTEVHAPEPPQIMTFDEIVAAVDCPWPKCRQPRGIKCLYKDGTTHLAVPHNSRFRAAAALQRSEREISMQLSELRERFIRPDYACTEQYLEAGRLAGTEDDPSRCRACSKEAVVNNVCGWCGKDERARFGDFQGPVRPTAFRGDDYEVASTIDTRKAEPAQQDAPERLTRLLDTAEHWFRELAKPDTGITTATGKRLMAEGGLAVLAAIRADLAAPLVDRPTIADRMMAEFQAYWDRHDELKTRASGHPVTEVERRVAAIYNERWQLPTPPTEGERR